MSGWGQHFDLKSGQRVICIKAVHLAKIGEKGTLQADPPGGPNIEETGRVWVVKWDNGELGWCSEHKIQEVSALDLIVDAIDEPDSGAV